MTRPGQDWNELDLSKDPAVEVLQGRLQPRSTPSCRVPEGHDAHDLCGLVDLVVGVVANT